MFFPSASSVSRSIGFPAVGKKSICQEGAPCPNLILMGSSQLVQRVPWVAVGWLERGLGLDSMIFPCLTWGVYQKFRTFLPEISQAKHGMIAGGWHFPDMTGVMG